MHAETFTSQNITLEMLQYDFLWRTDLRRITHLLDKVGEVSFRLWLTLQKNNTLMELCLTEHMAISVRENCIQLLFYQGQNELKLYHESHLHYHCKANLSKQKAAFYFYLFAMCLKLRDYPYHSFWAITETIVRTTFLWNQWTAHLI